MTYYKSKSNDWERRRDRDLKNNYDYREIHGFRGFHKGKRIPLMVVRNFPGYSRKTCDHLAKRWVTDESQVYSGRCAYLDYGCWFHNPRNIRKKTWAQREIDDHHHRP